MTARDTISSDEFLRLHEKLADNQDLRARFEQQIVDLCVTQPDDAAQISRGTRR